MTLQSLRYRHTSPTHEPGTHAWTPRSTHAGTHARWEVWSDTHLHAPTCMSRANARTHPGKERSAEPHHSQTLPSFCNILLIYLRVNTRDTGEYAQFMTFCILNLATARIQHKKFINFGSWQLVATITNASGFYFPLCSLKKNEKLFMNLLLAVGEKVIFGSWKIPRFNRQKMMSKLFY